MRRLPPPLLAGLAALSLCLLAVVAPATARDTGAFPVTVGSGSTAVRIAARPLRILSLSASATQMLYAMGAATQVVGVDKYSTWPANAPRTQFTGGETSAEDYLTLHPDLVLLAYDSSHLVAQLAKLRVPALVLGPATTIAAAETEVRELGAATGNARGATSEVAALQRSLATIVASAKGAGKGASYYIEYDPTLYSGTSQTFAGALLARLGMLDIADAAKAASAYPQLSAEFIVARNPKWVILADTVCCGQSATSFAKRPALGDLGAVKDHHVIPVADSLASQWGPHTMEAFLQTIVAAIRSAGR